MHLTCFFFLMLCRLSKTDPMQKPRRYRQLTLNTYPNTSPTLDHTAGWVGETQMFPHSTKHNWPHCYLLTCWKIPTLAWHQAQVITKPGRGWTLLKLGNLSKDLGASFFFFLPPSYNKNQQFCKSDLHFLNPITFHIKEVYVPKHMWA